MVERFRAAGWRASLSSQLVPIKLEFQPYQRGVSKELEQTLLAWGERDGMLGFFDDDLLKVVVERNAAGLRLDQ